MKQPPQIWDCDSSLYDSFELRSFERHLLSAISSSSRTLSMPRLPNHHHAAAGAPPKHPAVAKKKKLPAKISDSIHKLFRSFLKPNNKREQFVGDGFYDKSSPLSTISEGFEFDFDLSPEIRSLVNRSSSERWNASSYP